MALIDRAIYAAVAATSSPRLDRPMRQLSSAANYSRLWLAASAVLALAGGRRGRRAASSGLTAAMASAVVVNVGIKPFLHRGRPDRTAAGVPGARRVRMPASRSFPSGHAATAVAFASGAGRVMPVMSAPLHTAAALVAYSRVHVGVHYPGDALAGAVLGAVVADITASALAKLRCDDE
ncbi:MAG TPA: phosphatase PAP2 family protein [Solirubrobacteraceae bacterium]